MKKHENHIQEKGSRESQMTKEIAPVYKEISDRHQ